jgi:hypothetical protein
MCTFNTASGCDCRCECDVLLREDRDLCPEHGTKAQAVQAPRRVSVGRTQPLWEDPSESAALDEIWEMVERAHYEGRITWQQRGLFLWAVRKAREAESGCGQYGAPVREL